MNLPKYKCHKEVLAAKIKSVVVHDPPPGMPFHGGCLFLDLPDEGPITVSPEYLEKHNPQPGGFFIVYLDGYESYSPAKAFADGYSLIEIPLSEPPPVDRSQRILANGKPEAPDHREIDQATGQQKGYIVLSADERAKGFVRPVRATYTHKTCGTDTTMGLAIAETYARDPGFYSGTFCCQCRTHFPLDQFVWKATDQIVGS